MYEKNRQNDNGNEFILLDYYLSIRRKDKMLIGWCHLEEYWGQNTISPRPCTVLKSSTYIYNSLISSVHNKFIGIIRGGSYIKMYEPLIKNTIYQKLF